MDRTDIEELDESNKKIDDKLSFYRKKISNSFIKLQRYTIDKSSVIKCKSINYLLKIKVETSKNAKDLLSILKNPETYKLISTTFLRNIKKIYSKIKDPKKLITRIANELKFRFSQFIGTTKHKSKIFYVFQYLEFKERVSEKFNQSVHLVTKYKKQLTITTAAISVIFSGLLIYNANIGYTVTFNGEQLGIVKDQAVMNKAVGVVSRELSQWYNKEMVFKTNIKFEKTYIDKDQLLANVDETVNALYNTDIELSVKGAVILIEGEEVTTLASKEEAEQVLADVLEPYVSVSSNEKLIGKPVIKESYEIVEELVNFADVREIESAVSLIGQGTEETQSYLVKKGDTSWDIAVNRGVNISQLEKANPDKDITDLHDGDVLNLSVAKPYLTIEAQKEVTIEEKIPYDTQYKNDSTLYVGKKKVVSEGIKGTKQIVALINYENGKQVAKEILSEEITAEPVDEIVAKGTKPLPPARGTGRFMMPTSGRISAINKPGTHAGGRAIDIANSTGTSVYASDSGTVVKASYQGSYGNCIVIDHGNGYSTRYAHLSKYGVSVGDRVTKGQYIAAMGSTGNSTGPHLHFEIMINGSRQRIANYFGYIALGRHVSP
ncbi:MAG: peptidoglycan DD-metalloendopeptidase family protein [Eubacteriales bacterium]